MSKKILDAIRFAKEHHGQQMYGTKPYMYHLAKVAAVAKRYGGDDFDVVCCLLHDVIEDTPATMQDVKQEFGAAVAAVVDLVTNQPTKAETFRRIRSNRNAVFVKLCDRIANVSEGGKLSKYRSEHSIFKSILYRPGEFDDMWSELDSRLNTHG